MGKIISVSNQKGGVGKTTTVINLSSSIAKLGKKVLLMDMDPQGNLGSGLGLDINTLENSSYELLIGAASPQEIIKKTYIENLSLIPSNINLSGSETDLLMIENREFKLKNALRGLRSNYDFIFIDCPPSLGLLTINALCASDSVMVTLQTEYFALEGLTQLMRVIQMIQENLNRDLELEGVVLTMFDKRTNLANQVVDDVRSFFKEKVFKTIIPRSVKLGEAPSFGKSILDYEPIGVGSNSYKQLALEFLRKNGMNNL